MDKSWWQRPCAKNVSISFLGWDPGKNRDNLQAFAVAGICLPTAASEGRWFNKICSSPEELWDYLRALDTDPEPVLLAEFNYSGPAEPRPIDIDDILSDIEL